MARARCLLAVLLLAACGRPPDLVVYCALDDVHARPLIRLFEERTGWHVEVQYDVEQTKTVGLVARIRAESARPRADVFWNNEVAHTVRLQRAGLTEPYASPAARAIPEAYRDPAGHWTGFAARARVILRRTDRPPAQVPRRVEDMKLPAFAPHGAMARPLTGTTLTHWAALATGAGLEPTIAWLREARAAGLRFGGGNADVMRRLCEGDFSWCLTDTDDAAAARRNGYPVDVIYPDQEEGGAGTLLIPNTICILRGARHPEAARRFVDFVLSEEVEARLAASDSEQIPLHPGVRVPDRVRVPGADFRPAAVDWEAVASALEPAAQAFQELFRE